MPLTESHSVTLHNGKIYVPVLVYETYFKGSQSVVFLNREKELFLLPVHPAAGSGLLLKIKNAKGDRVINAAEQLLTLGVDESLQHVVPVCWNVTIAGLHLAISV